MNEVLKNQEVVESINLEKIPDSQLLKLSRQEVGKLTSYTQELEDEIITLNKKIKSTEQLTPEDFKELKKDKIYNELKEKIRKLTKKVSELKKENEKLWCSNYQKSLEKRN